MKIAFIATAVTLLLSAIASGQEKKEQQKIKIIVSDDTGTKVLIDTVFSGNTPDSVKLQNGNVFYVRHGKGNFAMLNDEGKNQRQYSVTVISDGDKNKEITKEITVIGGDSTIAEGACTKNNKMVYSYVKRDRQGNDEKPEKYDIEVSTANPEKGELKSSRIIAKDGMVVTIEGKDEGKVKELASFIETKMGVVKK